MQCEKNGFGGSKISFFSTITAHIYDIITLVCSDIGYGVALAFTLTAFCSCRKLEDEISHRNL